MLAVTHCLGALLLPVSKVRDHGVCVCVCVLQWEIVCGLSNGTIANVLE